MATSGKNLFEISSQINIVIVTSDVDGMNMMKKQLSECGFRNVTHCDNATQALDTLADPEVGLVVADLQVNGMEGWQFVRTMRMTENIPEHPVVLTGKVECPVDQKELNGYGILGFLKRPNNKKLLMDLITKTYIQRHKDGTLENRYSKAKDSLIQEKTEDAISQYTDLKKITNNSIRSSVGLAQAHEQDHNSEMAAAALADVADSKDFNVLSIKLKLHLQHNNLKDARAKVHEIIAGNPDNVQFLVCSCMRICYSYKHFGLSKEIGVQAVGRGINGLEIGLALAKAHYRLGEFGDALGVITGVEGKFGVNLALLETKGRCLMKGQKYRDAVKCYEAAINLEPENAEIYFNAALACMGCKNIEHAKNYLERAIKISPGFFLAKKKLQELQAA